MFNNKNYFLIFLCMFILFATPTVYIKNTLSENLNGVSKSNNILIDKINKFINLEEKILDELAENQIILNEQTIDLNNSTLILNKLNEQKIENNNKFMSNFIILNNIFKSNNLNIDNISYDNSIFTFDLNLTTSSQIDLFQKYNYKLNKIDYINNIYVVNISIKL